MNAITEQQLVPWSPFQDLGAGTPSFGDIEIESRACDTLVVTLPFEDGKLRLGFNDVRAFTTSWDGDPNPFITNEESAKRPSDLLKVEQSRWLASNHFNLDVESGTAVRAEPWRHFYIVAQERSLQIAARDDVEATWLPAT